MINEPKPFTSIRRVAIVGSGLAGLTAALRLQEKSVEVTVFEKSRGPGGRLAAKRVPGGSADVGAQYFTIRDPAFEAFLNRYASSDAYAQWKGRFGYQKTEGQWEPFPDEKRFVGTPRMTAISRALSSTVNVVAETRIAKFIKNGERYDLENTDGHRHGPFDAVIVTAPPAQTRDLLADSGLTSLAATLDTPVKHVQPCWAVAAHYAVPPFKEFDGMRLNSDVLSWAANNSSKPGRNDDGQWWVLHGHSEWSRANENTPAETVAGKMIRAFHEATGASGRPDDVVTHRWLYAKSSGSDAPGCFWFSEEHIGLAGDWLSGGRVEGAFESAEALVKAMFEVDT